MLTRMFKKDLMRKKTITFALFMFIALSALLVTSGANMVVDLLNSITALFEQSKAPHFVQMHAGKLTEQDQTKIDQFAYQNQLVWRHQVTEMIPIDSIHMTLNHDQHALKTSVMDHYFTQQNHSFDHLINLDSQPVQVEQGEIAVPIYYMQQYGMSQGDLITISDASFQREFTVVDLVRDAQMNPAIVHSKRLIVHEADYQALQRNFHDVEYLIQFQLSDLNKLSEFRQDYESSELPSKGPTIDYPLFKTLGAITDGVVATVMILISLLLSAIAFLCLRLTLLAVIEEDYQQIGVMKAIGIGVRDLTKLYVFKYVILSASAVAFGYLSSLFINSLFTRNISLYMGTAPKSAIFYGIPLLASLCIFLMVVCYSLFILRKFRDISAVVALRTGHGSEKSTRINMISLHKRKYLPVPFYLGLKDVFQRFKLYRTLLLVYIICSLIVIVPLNFLNTIQSPEFVKYMGIERSDLRIDAQQLELNQYRSMMSYIQEDEQIERFTPLMTSQVTYINKEGLQENMTIETGDFSSFPLPYYKGSAPIHDDEIALSYLNSKELELTVGDHLTIILAGEKKKLLVSGIYQDITNGGRTAKAFIASDSKLNPENILAYEVVLNVKSHVNVREKVAEYNELFHYAKVTDLADYLAQTFGHTIDQVKYLMSVAFVISLFMIILITSLFIKMLLAKDNTQITILKSIGLTLNDMRTKYITSTWLILSIGIMLGTLLAHTAGQSLVSGLLSFIGAAKITFVIDAMEAYVLYPFFLSGTVAITVILCTVSIGQTKISSMNAD